MSQEGKLAACYILTYEPTGKRYVGSTPDFAAEKVKILTDLAKGKCGCVKLQKLYDKDPNPKDFKWKAIITEHYGDAHVLALTYLVENWGGYLLLNSSKDKAQAEKELSFKTKAAKKIAAALMKTLKSSAFLKERKPPVYVAWVEPAADAMHKA